MWAVQAAGAPSHLVWQLKHGDVLISPMDEAAPQEPQSQAHTVVASTRTLQKLQTPEKPVSEKSQDPWQHFDPWQKKKEASVHQIASLEASVEQRVLAKLKQEDAPMQGDDTRVSTLEQQVASLHQTVETLQQTQLQQCQAIQQHAELQTKQVQAMHTQMEQQAQHSKSMQLQIEHQASCIGQLDHKIDSHQTSMNQLLDDKLGAQMRRIEDLFNAASANACMDPEKRARTE